MTVLQVASWFVIGVIVGFVGGWAAHVGFLLETPEMPADSLGEPPTIQERSGFLPGDADIFEEPFFSFISSERQEPQRAENPVQRKTETALFQRKDGTPVDAPHAWVEMARKHGHEIAYDELSPMFLDQFLLRYDHDLMPKHQEFVLGLCHYPSPWQGFTAYCPWAKERPLLFEQLTGYKLNELQLNNAIAEYVRRLQNNDAKEQAKAGTQ